MSDVNNDRVYVPKKAIPQKVSYSPNQLYEMLCKLSPEQINWIVFYLRIPKLMIPSTHDTIGEKAQAIISFAENSPGVGMEKLSVAVQKATTNAPAKAKGGAGVWVVAGLLLVGGAAYYFLAPPASAPTIEAQKVEAPTIAAKPLLTVPKEVPATLASIAPPAATTPANPPPAEAPATAPTPSEPPPSKPPPSEPEPVAKIAPGTVLLFDSSSTEVVAAHYNTLDAIAEMMSNASDVRLRVEGHADPEGGSARNIRISQERAREVKKYLTAKGIAAKRIETAGCGDRVPLGDATTPEGLTKSRRVEFSLLEKDSPKACAKPLP